MKIKGIDGLTGPELQMEIEKGGKFVYYLYCVSILILTFKRSSAVYFVKAGESRVTKGMGYILLSALVGWWGIPWGPIYTIEALNTNLKGGKDVTNDVVAIIAKAFKEPSPLISK